MQPRPYRVLAVWRVATCFMLSLSVPALSAPLGTSAVLADDLPALESSQLEGTAGRSTARASELAVSYGELPLSFVANQGQLDPAVDFVARGHAFSVFLTADEMVLSLRQPPAGDTVVDQPPAVLRVRLLGADPRSPARGEQPLPGTANYFLGNDPRQWRTAVPTFSQVRYSEVYPGVDLDFYGRQDQLEYDFIVAPGADPGRIRLGVTGTNSVQFDETAGLVMQLPEGQLRHAQPIVYQDTPEGRRLVDGELVLNAGQEIAFVVGAYDVSLPLVIDPVLVYSTYLGGKNFDQGSGIAVDSAGNAYVAGATASPDFPVTAGAAQQTFAGGSDVFVSKLNPAGTALVYSTFLGGSRTSPEPSQGGTAIAVDAAGNAYVTGGTDAADFPTTPGALQRVCGGCTFATGDVFVTKLNAAGTVLAYSTFLGGSGSDVGVGIAVDAAGGAYVTGLTVSPDFPTTQSAFQRTFRGGDNAFVARLNGTGTSLVYSTFLNGSGGSEGLGIAVDAVGNAYVTGDTGSPDFPTTAGAFQRTLRGLDAFVTKLNPLGTAPLYSTLLGGSGFDRSSAIALDAAGSAYVTGLTGSDDFPTTPGAFQSTFADVFVTKLNPAGTGLVYSTFLGTSFSVGGAGIAVDANGSAYVTGRGGAGFPTTPGALRFTLDDSTKAFVSKLNATGTALGYSTLLGGSDFAQGVAIAVDAAGNAYVTGVTTSPDWPNSPGAVQRLPGGEGDGFVAKLTPGPPACAVASLLAGPPAQLRVAVHADLGLTSVVVTQSSNLRAALPTFASGSTDTVFVTATKLDQTIGSELSMRVTDRTGTSTLCDPSMVTVGRAPGTRSVSVLRHIPEVESHVTLTNNTVGIDRLRLIVNGREFVMADLRAGETHKLDVSPAMHPGATNTLVIVSHGPRGGSAVVLVSEG
jgi:hypothetical protein